MYSAAVCVALFLSMAVGMKDRPVLSDPIAMPRASRTPQESGHQRRATTALHEKLVGVTTLGMGSGAYTDIQYANYRSATWVLNSPTWFEDAGFSAPSSPGNIIDSAEKADSYATFVTSWILETLRLDEHVDGNIIVIDLEDQGVDVALGFADWATAVADANGNYGAWVFGNPYQTGTYSADWTSSSQYVIQALRTITSSVRDAYPESPIGWYNGGPHNYSTWYGKLGQGASSSNYKVADKYFELTAARDPRMSSWKWVDPDEIGADFGFVSFYPNLTNLNSSSQQNSHFTEDDRESIQNWNYLILKHGGPSTSGWAGIWDRMFIGQPHQWVITNGLVYAQSEHPLETLAKSGEVGSKSCGGTTSTNPLEAWTQATLTGADYIPSLVAKGGDPGAILNPYQPYAVLLDYLAWQWTESCSDMPDGYQTVAHQPSAVDVQTGATLPDRWHQMNFAIFDAFFTGPHDFDSSSTTRGPRDQIADGVFSGTNLNSSPLTILARILADPAIYARITELGIDVGATEMASVLDDRARSYVLHVAKRRGIFLGGTPGGKADFCATDLNGDATVDAVDLGLMIGEWGDCHFDCVYDVDADGTVGPSDLGSLLGHWGSCP